MLNRIVLISLYVWLSREKRKSSQGRSEKKAKIQRGKQALKGQLLIYHGLNLKFLQKTDLGPVKGKRDQIKTPEQMQDPLKEIQKQKTKTTLKRDGIEACMLWP